MAALATLVHCALVGAQMQRPLMYDDANFALAARAVAETGLPFGNQGWMSERGDFSQREQWALWHPPLYVYLLGLFSTIGGWTAPILRLPGLLSGLATAALTYLLGRDLTHGPSHVRGLAGGAAVALALLSPLTVQSALILDIDYVLLLPLSLLFVWLYTRLEATRRRWLLLAPLFSLLLWAKMTNPLALLAVVGAWQALRGLPARAAAHVLVIVGGGALLFALTWVLIGRWLGFPLDMPFAVNALQWQDSAEVARRAYVSPGAFVEGLQPTTIWLGPGLVVLGLAGVGLRAARVAAWWRFRQADLLIGLVILLVLSYVNKSAGWFPKYQVSLAPLLACLAGPIIAHTWCARPRWAAATAALALAVTAAVVFRLVRDDWALGRTWAIELAPAQWLLAIVVMPGLVGLAWRAGSMPSMAALAGLSIGWNVAIGAHQLAAPYSTGYWYGTRSTLEAAAWLDAHVQDGTYVAAKEVAIRARNQRYVDQDNLAYALSHGRGFDGWWAGQSVRAVVAWQREPYVAELFQRGLAAANFHDTARFGDYVVYEPPSGLP
ncbi:MAG: glycosyltransferase family 39 protein [Chloroflexota bacterium]|nr:glycosyltransferase family 39 protein [Chloroflexota bacterium]